MAVFFGVALGLFAETLHLLQGCSIEPDVLQRMLLDMVVVTQFLSYHQKQSNFFLEQCGENSYSQVVMTFYCTEKNILLNIHFRLNSCHMLFVVDGVARDIVGHK